MNLRILILVFFYVSNVWGGNLSAPFVFESATVLPKGVRNVTYAGFTTQAFNKYNTDGNSEAIGKALNKNLTWQDIINGQSSTIQAQSIQALLLEMGKDLNEVVGSTAGVVNARATVNAPVLAYGVSKKWTVAVAVPVVYTNINVDTGFLTEENLQNFVGNELVARNLSAQAEAAAAKFVDLVNQKAVSNGYSPIEDQEKTMIGDVKLINKYLVTSTKKLNVAIKQELVFPTGETPDPHKVVDIGAGDGQWDIGLGVAADYKMNTYFSFTAHANYLMQLSDNVTRHIPISSAETISPDVDNDVYRDLGDIWGMGFAGHLTLFETLKLSSGYQYQWKNADEYIGDQFQASRYEILEFDTHQQMHSLLVGLEFSTIPLFRKKKFFMPLQVALGNAWVLAGENVNSDSVLNFRLSAFF